MVSAEADLMRSAAKMCCSLNRAYVLTREATAPTFMINRTRDNADRGREVLALLVQRYLRTL
jgi:hypothetical protein